MKNNANYSELEKKFKNADELFKIDGNCEYNVKKIVSKEKNPSTNANNRNIKNRAITHTELTKKLSLNACYKL